MLEFITIGKVARPFKVQGWTKIHSFTEPVEHILLYSHWFLKQKNGWQPIKIAASCWHNKQLVVKFETINTPEQAKLITNLLIGANAKIWPDKNDNDYYWHELEGLAVITTKGELLGKIAYLLATGANDVIVVKGDKEHIVPYIPNEVVVKIDLIKGEMLVNWDPGF